MTEKLIIKTIKKYAFLLLKNLFTRMGRIKAKQSKFLYNKQFF